MISKEIYEDKAPAYMPIAHIVKYINDAILKSLVSNLSAKIKILQIKIV